MFDSFKVKNCLLGMNMLFQHKVRDSCDVYCICEFQGFIQRGSHCTGDARFYVAVYMEDAKFYAVIESTN
jgi:hypothetical protein